MMKDLADKVVFGFFGLFGASVGLLVYMFALGGWRFVFTGQADKPWNGLVSLIICCALGGGWGLASYKFNHPGELSGGSMFFDDPATAILFTKRLMVIASSLAGVYFIWQLAKGM